MTKQTKNKVVTVIAILLLAVAAFLTVQLFIGDDSTGTESENQTQVPLTTVTTTVPATEQTDPVTQENETEGYDVTSAELKYLWDYGPGNYNSGKTSEQG